MTKLTPQIIHLYWDAPAQLKRSDCGTIYEGKLFELYDGHFRSSTEWIKPILRRLSDMTEEEQSEYDRLQVTCYSTYKFIDQVLTDAKTINYLRSIGIDCDNLIDTNQAIEKP